MLQSSQESPISKSSSTPELKPVKSKLNPESPPSKKFEPTTPSKPVSLSPPQNQGTPSSASQSPSGSPQPTKAHDKKRVSKQSSSQTKTFTFPFLPSDVAPVFKCLLIQMLWPSNLVFFC